MAITWQNLKDLFYETVGDTEVSQSFFDETTVTAWANEALSEAAQRTMYADCYYAGTTTSGDPDFSIGSATSNQVWRVEVDGEKMVPITIREVRNIDRFWSTRTGTPRFYMMDETRTNAETLTVRLYETPSATGLTIKVFSYGVQVQISDSYPAYNVNCPEWFAYSLLFGMLARAYEADTEMRSYDKVKFYRRLWDDAVMRLRIRSFSRLNKQWAYRPLGQDSKYDIRNRLPETITGP